MRIPSPNPPGDTIAVADFVAEQMRAIGCVVRQPAPAQKSYARNTIATLGQGEPRIMLHAHIDTVPIGATEAQNWSVDPYAGVVRQGALYGKGSIDDKAVLASMMQVMTQAARQPKLKGTLILVAAAEEEVGGQLGTKWLEENACAGRVPGDQGNNQFFPFLRTQVDGDRALALVQSRPVQASPVLRYRPAPVVQSATDGIETDDIRAQLRQGHAPQRRGNKGGTFDDTQVF